MKCTADRRRFGEPMPCMFGCQPRSMLKPSKGKASHITRSHPIKLQRLLCCMPVVYQASRSGSTLHLRLFPAAAPCELGSWKQSTTHAYHVCWASLGSRGGDNRPTGPQAHTNGYCRISKVKSSSITVPTSVLHTVQTVQDVTQWFRDACLQVYV